MPGAVVVSGRPGDHRGEGSVGGSPIRERGAPVDGGANERMAEPNPVFDRDETFCFGGVGGVDRDAEALGSRPKPFRPSGGVGGREE